MTAVPANSAPNAAPNAAPANPASPDAAGSARLWIRNPLAAFTANGLDAGGGLVIENGVITEVLATGQAPAEPCAETFDASAHVLLPGLINTHHHFYQTLTRAWAPVVNTPLFPWLKNLYPVWATADSGGPGTGHHRGPVGTAAVRMHHRG